MKLKSLNCSFLSTDEILKLNLANIHTSEQLVAYFDLDNLSRISSVPVKSLKMIKKFIIGQYAPFPQLGNELFGKYVKNLFIIKFGCPAIDSLISNGIYSSEITEITGSSGAGKTQMCLNICANLFDSKPTHKCLYINSNKNFCIKRMKELLLNKNVNVCLNAIQVIDCSSYFHLIDLLHQIKKPSNLNLNSSCSSNEMEEVTYTPNLLVIDSLSSLFNFIKSTPQNNLEISFYLNTIMICLKHLAVNLNIAVLVTTDLMPNEVYSIFNESWKKFANLAILLRNSGPQENQQIDNDNDDEQNAEKHVESRRVFEVLKCNRPYLKSPNKTCLFKFSHNGFE